MLFGFIALTLVTAEASNEQAYHWRVGEATMPLGTPDHATDPVRSQSCPVQCQHGALPPT